MSESGYRAQDEFVITGSSLEELIKNLVFIGFVSFFFFFTNQAMKPANPLVLYINPDF